MWKSGDPSPRHTKRLGETADPEPPQGCGNRFPVGHAVTERETVPILDVDRIVADLQERVAARRAAGEYDQRTLGTRFELVEGSVVLRPELAYSAKRVVGTPLTVIKRLIIRLQLHFLNDIVAQVNAALATDRAKLKAESQRRAALEERVLELETRLGELHRSQKEADSTVG